MAREYSIIVVAEIVVTVKLERLHLQYVKCTMVYTHFHQ